MAKSLFGRQKGGEETFIDEKTWGLLLFSLQKGGGHCLYFSIKKGAEAFFTSQVLRGITFFADKSEPEQHMSLSKSENKLLEIN